MTGDAPSPVGAHAFIWTPRWDREGARLAASGAAGAGFDLIEVPLLEPGMVDTRDTVRVLDDAGLGCTCSLGLPADAHLPSNPDKAEPFLLEAVDVAAELGSPWLTGALYGNLGAVTGHPPTDAELDTVGRALSRVAARADELDVKLGIEVINRYETYLVNTTTQVIALLDRIDAPNVYAHLDTYHMNIEEDSFTEPVRRLGPRLGYVHLAESHRSVIGDGHVPFEELFVALDAVGYRGPLIVEGFLNADPSIRAATATWNGPDLDPDEFARSGKAEIDRIRRAIASS